MKEIKLSQCWGGNGLVALVDDEDYEYLSQFRWNAYKSGLTYYVNRNIRVGNKKTTIPMHREILQLKPGEFGDHINHNGLDNRRGNLRNVNVTQNNRNKAVNSGKKNSQYKGVYFRFNKWRTRIMKDGKNYNVGNFETEIEAAIAYDIRAKELFGEYAYLNFK